MRGDARAFHALPTDCKMAGACLALYSTQHTHILPGWSMPTNARWLSSLLKLSSSFAPSLLPAATQTVIRQQQHDGSVNSRVSTNRAAVSPAALPLQLSVCTVHTWCGYQPCSLSTAKLSAHTVLCKPNTPEALLLGCRPPRYTRCAALLCASQRRVCDSTRRASGSALSLRASHLVQASTREMPDTRAFAAQHGAWKGRGVAQKG